MFDKLKNGLQAKLPALATLLLLGSTAVTSANAAAVDVTSVTSVITDVTAAAATIGLAVLAMHYGIKAYKWIKGAG